MRSLLRRSANYYTLNTQHLTLIFKDPHQGLGDGVCQRHHVLQGCERHPRCGQRELNSIYLYIIYFDKLN